MTSLFWYEERCYHDGAHEIYKMNAEETSRGRCYSEKSNFEVRWHDVKSTAELENRARRALQYRAETGRLLRIVVKIPARRRVLPRGCNEVPGPAPRAVASPGRSACVCLPAPQRVFPDFSYPPAVHARDHLPPGCRSPAEPPEEEPDPGPGIA